MHLFVYVFICSSFRLTFGSQTVTLVRPKMQVDFRVEAEKTFKVEDLLKESGMKYQ